MLFENEVVMSLVFFSTDDNQGIFENLTLKLRVILLYIYVDIL